MKEYSKRIGSIRLLSCIAILLYHLSILKGGYLSVCTFFVLSGYLACLSCFKYEKLSISKYYLNRFLKIYLPLIIVIFLSIAVISFIPSINWFNLKPETNSVILGYNNFWQLNANLDYFARHIDSPFMHLWYIAIILQFNLIFPIIFKFLKFLGEKIHKCFPCIVIGVLAITMSIYFYYSSINGNAMTVYYDTFSRIFSLIFGILIGFMHHYYKSFVFNNKIVQNFCYYFYIVILIILNIFVVADSKYFSVAMILTTLISCRLIDYSVNINVRKLNIFDKVVKSLSNISYEIYLVQYPIIFLMQSVSIDEWLKYIIILLLTLIMSYIINFSLNYKMTKFKLLRYITFSILMFAVFLGTYKYVVAKDYTSEMKKLELQLAQNEELMKRQQEDYAKKLKEEQDAWNEQLLDFENYEKELPTLVSNLPVVGVGDSVMLGVVDLLHNIFPNGYFDAEKSRTAWVANGILQNLSALGILGNPVIMNLGANGDCDITCKNTIMSTLGDRKLFWINVPNYSSVNNSLVELASKYKNVYIIDWYSISRGHPEYFVADGVHLTPVGSQVYVDMIYNKIYSVYLDEYNEKKNSIIDSYNGEKNKKISFFGNELLLNVYSHLNKELPDTEFIIDSDINYDKLIEQLKDKKNADTLTHNIFLLFDKKNAMTKSQYKNIIELCNEHRIYIVNTDEDLELEETENVKVINFYLEISKNDDYLMPDKIHLSSKGNKALKNLILEKINEIN